MSFHFETVCLPRIFLKTAAVSTILLCAENEDIKEEEKKNTYLHILLSSHFKHIVPHQQSFSLKNFYKTMSVTWHEYLKE